jgi:phosphopantothenoylcysteine decarboxylase/phosphopantothenate--cysteine ligase
VQVVAVETAKDMLTASMVALPCDIAICAAAVADWSVEQANSQKIKKTEGKPPSLNLTENPDILATISSHQMRPQLVIGFAAETHNIVSYAEEKRIRKGCDWILANDVGGEEPVFGADENRIHFITEKGAKTWPRMSKHNIADALCREIISTIAS